MKLLTMALLYYNMVCQINIGELQFNTVNSVTINQSIKQLSDTAKITLPRNYSEVLINGVVESLQNKNITEYIKVDDPVVIKLGYDLNLETEFEGYVKRVSADTPLSIECEDEMLKLRKSSFNESFKSVTLTELLKVIAPAYEHEVIDDISLGKFIIQNASAFETLEALKKDYLLHSYFKGKNLIVGFPSAIVPEEAHEYHLTKNVRNSENLEFVKQTDLKLEIKAISNNSDGTKKVVTVGETGGSTRTLNFANKTETDLKQLAEANLKSLSFDGYQGSLSGFGLPRAKAGDAAKITDPKYPDSEREGTYLIEEVTKTFNKSDGFKNEVKLSLKIS